MGILSETEPTKVFHFFQEICEIPHGSGNIKEISDYLVKFAKDRNLFCRQDEKYNVIIKKSSSKGRENCKPVILQGHMDMVAVKDESCKKDMDREGLDLEIDGDLLSAKGTSLGGDDGIAVAYMLAILDDEDMIHPPLEAVFTVDEEIGMLGADFLDVSDLEGRYLMNMDSEDEGVFTVSCAGGATAVCEFPYKKEPVNAPIIEIRMEGFQGGHSGTEINKGRVNGNMAMGRILLKLFQNVGMRLITINGGEKDNAIPKFCEAAIAVLPQSVDRALDIINNTFREIKEEYATVETEAKLCTNVIDGSLMETLSDASTLAVIIALVNMPDGVLRMNPDIEGMVQTSANLGVLRTEPDQVKMSFAVRSSVDSEKQYAIEKISSLTEIFGGNVKVSGIYPGWEYNPESKLCRIMAEEYKKLYGKEPVVEGIHAGLECGIFVSKIPGLDAVSFGPQMKDIHTAKETLSISSVKRTWELIVRVLEALQ